MQFRTRDEIETRMGGECECGSEGVSSTRRESAYDMMRVETAVNVVLEHAAPLEVVALPAHRALGYVLAEPVLSTVSGSLHLSLLAKRLCCNALWPSTD